MLHTRIKLFSILNKAISAKTQSTTLAPLFFKICKILYQISRSLPIYNSKIVIVAKF